MDTTTIHIMGRDYPLESPGFVRARQIVTLALTDPVLGDYAALLLCSPRLRAKIKIPDYSAVLPLATWTDEYAPLLTDTKNDAMRADLQRDVIDATRKARSFVWSLLPTPKEVEERADFFDETTPAETGS